MREGKTKEKREVIDLAVLHQNGWLVETRQRSGSKQLD